MQDVKIINYVVIAGEAIPWEDLPEDKRRKVAELIQDNMMISAGYKRTSA